jgi:hypothetical protein
MPPLLNEPTTEEILLVTRRQFLRNASLALTAQLLGAPWIARSAHVKSEGNIEDTFYRPGASGQSLILELTMTRRAKEETLISPGEIHSADKSGEYHLLSEKNGILFYEGKRDRYIFAMCLRKPWPERD